MNRKALKLNLPSVVGKERDYVNTAIGSVHLAGDGPFSQKVQALMADRFGMSVLPTPSCTDALEMTALLSNLGPGDEVIVPSFSFVSPALAFAMRGCRLVFADSDSRFPHIGWDQIEPNLSSRTKAVVVVDYAGSGHDLERIERKCRERGVILIEDAAQAIGVRYGVTGRWLGSFGDAGTFSFHATKNVSCGEGGALVLNRMDWRERSYILWEKGTNRRAFFQGLVDKYGWVDCGSSFLPNELTMAYLLAQLERVEWINRQRIAIWEQYFEAFEPLEKEGLLKRQLHPPGSDHNGHLFYILLPDTETRRQVSRILKTQRIQSAFHFQSLHRSKFAEGLNIEGQAPCPESDRFSDTLLRMPLNLSLLPADVERVVGAVRMALIC